ncbi:hypothetical protein Plec18167_006425 [Paecilomyces lecythidis]|uniref:Major facilitator superfamily (MFS) profile domain-containing protein n=1 Tax=Paecilomyces lecythidis TaxID=3004212 RepID=A0ABR3XCM4_9EURO
MATALSPNLGAQLTFRFFAGFFGSTPLVCAGGSLTDLWSPKENIYVFPVFAVFSFIGNGVGPPIGGYLGQYGPSWRWVDWVTTILAGVLLLAVIFFLPETFKPMLWKWKAQHLRKIAGDERYKAPSEIEKGTSLPRQLFESLYRPFFLTIYEPIIMPMALYLTITYVILFTSLNGYTFMFSDTYGFDQGKTGLCFLGMMVGNFLALLLVPLLDHLYTRDLRKVQERTQVSQDSNSDEGYEHAENQQVKNIVPPPESQLYASMFGAPFIPISLFWMEYTTRPDISPWSAIIGSVPFGFGFVLVFVTCYEYLMDSYAIYAASALASASCIRYLAAGGMMPVSFRLYSNLGVQWTLTLLGGLSALMVPVPSLP